MEMLHLSSSQRSVVVVVGSSCPSPSSVHLVLFHRQRRHPDHREQVGALGRHFARHVPVDKLVPVLGLALGCGDGQGVADRADDLRPALFGVLLRIASAGPALLGELRREPPESVEEHERWERVGGLAEGGVEVAEGGGERRGAGTSVIGEAGARRRPKRRQG